MINSIYLSVIFVSLLVIGILSRVKMSHLKRKLLIHGFLTLYLLIGIALFYDSTRKIIGVFLLSLIIQSITYGYLKFNHPDSKIVQEK
jgi:hypothetical protein